MPAEQRPAEAPLLECTSGWPRDLLSWVVATPQLLYVAAVAVVVPGFLVFAAGFVATGSNGLSGALGLIAAGFAWRWWAREHFGISGDRVRFYPERIAADLLVADPENPRRARRQAHDLGYDRIGTVCLNLQESALLLRFALPGPGRRSCLRLRLPRLSARDHCDEVIQWIEAAAPEHLFCVDTDETLEYSRPFAFAELFPGAAEISGDVTFGLGEGGTDNGYRDSTVEAGDRRYRVVPGPFRGRIHPAGDPNRTLLAWSYDEPPRKGPRMVRIFAAYGVEIGRFALAPDPQVQLEFGWGGSLRLDRRGNRFRLAPSGTTGGLSRRGAATVLALDGPMSEPELLSLAVVQQYRPWPSIVATPAQPAPARTSRSNSAK